MAYSALLVKSALRPPIQAGRQPQNAPSGTPGMAPWMNGGSYCQISMEVGRRGPLPDLNVQQLTEVRHKPQP